METNAAGSGRVAMLAHTYYLRDPRVRRQAEALADAGVEIHVIALAERDAAGHYEPRHAVVNGVELHRLPIIRRRGSLLRYVLEYFATAVLGTLALTLLQLRGRLDVVHVHNMPDLLVFAAIIPWLCGSTIVLDVHDPMPELFKSWDQGASNRLLVALLGLQEKLSCAFADRVVSVNETMRENLRAKGVADEKICIVNNFPDQSLFPVSDPPTSWPRSKDTLVVLYCGTVTEHYDLGLAVRAIARLAGEVPVRLKILGDGNRLAEVLNLATELGVKDSVEHVGSVPIDKVHAELKKADIGISCHRAGVFGDLYFSTKIVEYLTQGLPVLSPRTKTICRYLPDDCMFYFEPGNVAALADCLRFVWQNPAEVSRRLANAKDVLPRLSWQSEKGQFVSFYRGLMSKKTDERTPVREISLPLNKETKPATLPRYVLVTPARNEATFIELTIQSVIAQTVLPLKWVIVSDGSTDSTDEIVQKYLADHDWLELVRLPERAQRNFAGKAIAFNAGYARVAGLDYDVIGNLDADLSFEPDYFEFLMGKFAENARLGVGGTPFVEGGRHYDYRFTNIEHVSGACQLFRRDCFDAIGGYLPIKGGGIDWTAVTTARLKGWQTRTFTEKTCLHHRTMGTGSASRLRGLFRHGQKDRYLGGHPVWQIARSVYQMTRRPYVIGGLALLVGYFWALLRRAERPISEELVRFHQAEQIARLKGFFRRSTRCTEVSS